MKLNERALLACCVLAPSAIGWLANSRCLRDVRAAAQRNPHCSRHYSTPRANLPSLKSVRDIVSEHQRVLPSRAEILHQLELDHDKDANISRQFSIEAMEVTHQRRALPGAWMSNECGEHVVLQTRKPLFSASQVQTLRTAAESYWATACDSAGTTSRFTYQLPGNSEVHLWDLDRDVKQLTDQTLFEKIYPTIRSHFGDELSNDSLCVYDALFIRYNATAAKLAGQSLAGQPLHRDLGLVSINVMLNDNAQFEGGGTYFDGLQQVVHPKGAGHALLHASSQRHAGAGVSQGVRDIFVIFVTSTALVDALTCLRLLGPSSPALRRERNANFSEEQYQLVERLQRCLMAVEYSPSDAEAWFYLGSALCQYVRNHSRDRPHDKGLIKAMNTAIECLAQALKTIKYDGRVHHSMALALKTRAQLFESMTDDAGAIENAFLTSSNLWQQADAAGCDVEDQQDAALLSHGLFASRCDEFVKAMKILEPVARKPHDPSNGHASEVQRDAFDLYSFCEKQVLLGGVEAP